LISSKRVHQEKEKVHDGANDNFRMNTSYGRYGAAYNMVALICLNDKLSCV
jgi:hypothetical protein